MKVIMVTPYYHQQRGNTVTVRRISDALTRLGLTTEILSLTYETKYPPLPTGDIVHGFNAYQFNEYWKYIGSPSIPYMITLTGTDLNHRLFEEDERGKVIETLNGAKAIHVFNEKARTLLWQEVPEVMEKTCLIPQGIVDFPTHVEKQQKDNFQFVLPAGIRKVKNIPAAISMMVALQKHYSNIRLVIVGPVLENDEGDRVQELVQQHHHWIKYLGQVDHLEMGEIYSKADVVLNTSFSEGQSSAILEGMAQGLPVLVSNITGNQDVVKHGETGFLYQNELEFVRYAKQLMEDEILRRTMGMNGKAYVDQHHSVDKEAKNIAAIYYKML